MTRTTKTRPRRRPSGRPPDCVRTDGSISRAAAGGAEQLGHVPGLGRLLRAARHSRVEGDRGIDTVARHQIAHGQFDDQPRSLRTARHGDTELLLIDGNGHQIGRHHRPLPDVADLHGLYQCGT
jgi:hypothetical protein